MSGTAFPPYFYFRCVCDIGLKIFALVLASFQENGLDPNTENTVPDSSAVAVPYFGYFPDTHIS